MTDTDNATPDGDTPHARGSRISFGVRANLVAGVLTIIPLVAVWFVLDLLFNLLSSTGRPLIVAVAAWVEPSAPDLAHFLQDPTVLSAIAAFLVLVILYIIGLLAAFVVGQQIIAWFEALIARIPFVQSVYGATKQLLSSLQTKPAHAQRVVLIDFPQPGMRAIGLVTKTFTEVGTGRQLAAVYVPTTPNPTSGYLEIVPVENLIATDLTMEQAMTMVISGGAVSPDSFTFSHPRERT